MSDHKTQIRFLNGPFIFNQITYLSDAPQFAYNFLIILHVYFQNSLAFEKNEQTTFFLLILVENLMDY